MCRTDLPLTSPIHATCSAESASRLVHPTPVHPGKQPGFSHRACVAREGGTSEPGISTPTNRPASGFPVSTRTQAPSCPSLCPSPRSSAKCPIRISTSRPALPANDPCRPARSPARRPPPLGHSRGRVRGSGPHHHYLPRGHLAHHPGPRPTRWFPQTPEREAASRPPRPIPTITALLSTLRTAQGAPRGGSARIGPGVA